MGFYRPPSIDTIRQETQSSVVLTGGEVIPALIGPSSGKTTAVTAYEAAMGTGTTYTFPTLAPAGPATAIAAIRSTLQGGIRYEAGVDFIFSAGPQTIAWQSVALSAPYITKIEDVTAASSSLNPATTYYYVVTAIRPLDLTGPVIGETVASNEVSAKPLASTSRLKLTWRAVAGATGYKIYRSTASGNYTGSALLTTISSGFTTTYTDSGTSTVAGSPPGVAVFARLVAGIDTPSTIAPGSTFGIEVNSVLNTVTLAGTAAARSGSGATYPVTITAGVSDTLVIKINDEFTSNITLAPGVGLTLAQIINDINPQLDHGFADDNSGQLRITSDDAGSQSKVEFVGGTAMSVLGLTVGVSTGTGDLPNFNDVTAADLVGPANDDIAGATASVDASGRLAITHDTAGVANTLQANAAANTLLGFSTTLVTGNDATPGTALRRPALNGDLFYVDYSYVKTEHFVGKRFTNLTRAISEYGLGSRLAIGATLAMGTSGRGNGASQIVAMAVPEDTIDAYQTALDALKARKDVTLVVPLTVIDGINTSTKAHCLEASDNTNKRERRAVLGTPKGTLVGDEDMVGSAVYLARQLDNERAILVHPWPFVRVQNADGTVAETELDGWASAVAVAGRIAALNDRAESPTQKQVFGISKLGVELDEPDENTLGGAGVCVLATDNGNIVIRDGITTSLASTEESRIQIGLVDDLLRQTLRAQFKNFRGRKLLPSLLRLIKRRTLRILALFQKLQLISGYNPQSVDAEQDTDVLTTVNATLSYRAMYDLRDIIFRYSLDLTTGTIA